MWEMKQVIVIPSDVKMSPAKLAVQVAHASFTSIWRHRHLYPEKIEKWFAEGFEQKKVVLKIDTSDDLLILYRKALLEQIPCALIRDAGRTELEANTITALGFFPLPNEEIDKLTKGLSLY